MRNKVSLERVLLDNEKRGIIMAENNKFCPNCGMKNDSEDLFCGNCGTRLEVQIDNHKSTVAAAAPKQVPLGVNTQNNGINNVTPKSSKPHIYNDTNNEFNMGGQSKDAEKGKSHATTSLVLGIISVVCWFFGYSAIVSVICGFIGLTLAGKAKEEGFEDGIRTAGFVLSLIGLIGGAVVLVACVACVGSLGMLGASL